MSEVAFGLDVGTTGVRGVAVDPAGTVTARAHGEYALSTPRPGWAEQDPADWWAATEAVLRRLRASAGPPAGVGVSGQMHGLVALDSRDRVLRPAILWNDQRTAAECRKIEERVGTERLVELTGNRALTGFTAPKLLWLARHEPDVYARIARVALPKDYVRLRLCGEHATDVSDASGTLLFDVAARDWSEEALDALEVPRAWLPRALESPEASGQIDGGVPVAAGAGDQAAGALGVGAGSTSAGPASVVLGTSGVVFAGLDAFAADPRAAVHVFCHAVPGTWHAMGVMLSAGGALRWLRDALAPGAAYAELVGAAAAWPPGAEGLTFLPYLAGERTPHSDPDARGAFVGLGLRHDRGALVRAVLEGVAFGLRDCLEALAQVGTRPRVARVSGGGTRSELWLEIVASVLELPLERVAVDEGAAFGAALLGGVAGGLWPDVRAAMAATVAPGPAVQPRPEWVEAYRAGHERFRALYPALRGA
ncbi:MAG TPA: xylulokinase [Solirubrobacteraceae bacterium]|nr:xylulokinase [Solirubrobacteraceae bacterium]